MKGHLIRSDSVIYKYHETTSFRKNTLYLPEINIAFSYGISTKISGHKTKTNTERSVYEYPQEEKELLDELLKSNERQLIVDSTEVPGVGFSTTRWRYKARVEARITKEEALELLYISKLEKKLTDFFKRAQAGEISPGDNIFP